ncbi:serine/threonine protein kinase [Planotetraspora thailandica]|uniref:Serine/threonine protein kinase n=1 Tax=Planotetraspora thailandica TaxID=487172 RepID=A0A8J3XY20_9ACTN|nr:serpin family protein [Planotetraspora thailandica]GII56691.1 serine/threonine protein kinase [Planotetraspora thailandica]
MLTVEGVSREVPKNAPVAEVARGVTAFGYALYEKTAQATVNTVISPLSIAYAFGMARAGAAGATASELDKVFGFPASGPHAAFNALIRQIGTIDGPPPAPDRTAVRDAQSSEPSAPVVGIANGLFAQQGMPVKQDFLRTLASQYGAGVRTVDFGKDAADAINAWVDEQTAGRIKKLFEQLDPATLLVIANAVYLKADWEHAFVDPAEENAAFTRADGSTVRTRLMRQTTDLRHASGSGWQAVELPYAKSDLAMWVLVPERGASPDGLLKPDTLRQVAAGLRTTSVSLHLPRWNFGTDLGLEEPLKKLGLNAVFDGADFSGIADNLFISQAVHRANITVDEWGTEAAAVTGLAFAVSGRLGPDTEVRADHPFAFAIMHRPTSTPLFIGHVANPAASA